MSLRAAVIEPDLVDRAVAGEKLVKLADDKVVVLRVAHLLGAKLRAGIVKPRLDAELAAGVDKFPHDVARSAPPRRALDRELRILRRPQSEAVVVLRGQNGVFRAGVADGADPLAAVERGRVEALRSHRQHIPVAVFLVKGADAEMKENPQLRIEKGELRLGGNRGGHQTGHKKLLSMFH